MAVIYDSTPSPVVITFSYKKLFLVGYNWEESVSLNRYKFENSNQIFIFAIRQYAYHNTMWIIGKGLHR